MKYCQACGQQNAEDARFCEKCGSALAESAPVPQAPQSTAPTVDLASSAQDVMGRLRGMGRAPMFAVGGVLVLLVIYMIAFRPMSTDKYEDLADEHSLELSDATGEIWDALNEYRSYNESFDSEDTLDGDDWDDTRSEIKDALSTVKKSASKIRGLRPPSEYKSADRKLNDWAEFYAGDWADEVEELLDDVEDGDEYGQVDTKLSRFDSATERGTSGAWRDLSRAGSDLDLTITMEGE